MYADDHQLYTSRTTVFIRLNAAACIKFFVIRKRRLFEGGVYLKSNLFLERKLSERALTYTHFELKNIVINESKFPKLDQAELPYIVLVFFVINIPLSFECSDLKTLLQSRKIIL